MDDYKKLVNRLREEPKDSRKVVLSIYDLCIDAAYAIEILLDKLKHAEAERDAVTRHMIELEQEVCRLKSRLSAYEDSGLEPEEIKVHEAAKYNAGYYHGDEDRCRWIEKELGPIDHIRDLIQAEQDERLVVLDEKTVLSMYAGARAIENNKRLFGATYVYDIFGKQGGPKEIPYFDAANNLRNIASAIAQKGGED